MSYARVVRHVAERITADFSSKSETGYLLPTAAYVGNPDHCQIKIPTITFRTC